MELNIQINRFKYLKRGRSVKNEICQEFCPVCRKIVNAKKEELTTSIVNGNGKKIVLRTLKKFSCEDCNREIRTETGVSS